MAVIKQQCFSKGLYTDKHGMLTDIYTEARKTIAATLLHHYSNEGDEFFLNVVISDENLVHFLTRIPETINGLAPYNVIEKKQNQRYTIHWERPPFFYE